MRLHVEVDTGMVAALAASLRAPVFDEVAALALNDTAKNAEVEAAQRVGPMMGLASRDVKADLSVEAATPNHLESALVARGKPRKMIEFGPRATRQGVRLRIAGKVEVYRRAFVATVKHGHVGVFERKGRERLPIRELYGPSVKGILARSDVLPPLLDAMAARLVANLLRQIERRTRKGGRA